MKTAKFDVVIIGSGPAGLASAIAAKESKSSSVLIIERDSYPGGILQQCIHPGFGLKYFGEELTGPEYAQRFINKASTVGVEILFNTMAIDYHDDILTCINTDGVLKIEFNAMVLAMGCRERTRANLCIPGSRPAGIFTAGTAQKLINLQGLKVGKEVVILGSGDVGMIMARRLTLEGATVKAVVEIMPYLSGLIRNKVQCLDDFDIPLLLNHTIVDITGIDRVESVMVAPVDSKQTPILEKRKIIYCDTLLLSVGLIPENELTKAGGLIIIPSTKGVPVNQYMQTIKPNVFACGNVLHVNDLVDNVSREGEIAGTSAALFGKKVLPEAKEVLTVPGKSISYVSPQRIVKTGDRDVELFFRTKKPNHNVIFLARSRNKELAFRKAKAVSPGEMESLIIKKEMLRKIDNEITIEVLNQR